MKPLRAVYDAAAEHVRQYTNTLERVNAIGHELVDTSDDGTRITYAVNVAVEGDAHYSVYVVATVGTWRKIEVEPD